MKAASRKLGEFDLRKTLILSLVFHILVVIIFSITIRKNPFDEIKPIIVEIESVADSMSQGLSEQLETAQHSQAPAHNEPVLQESRTPTVPEKTLPARQKTESTDVSKLKESLQQQKQDSVKNQLKEKVVAKTGPRIDPQKQAVNTSDPQLKEILDKEEFNKIVPESDGQMDEDISRILQEDGSQDATGADIPESDPLKGADWSAAPRKTLFFPDIASRIPEEYRKKGQNYIIKMRITFDKNGLAVKTEVIRTSGDPMIDSIFQTELRKIKVEAINRDRLDEVVKTFTISLK